MLTVRAYQEGDIPALVELINQADAVDGRERGTTEQEQTERFGWPLFRPTENAFLWEKDGQLVAYGTVHLGEGEETREFYANGLVHPEWRGRGIGRQVLGRLIDRCVERRRVELTASTVYARAGCEVDEADRVALYESFGMKPVRYFIDMVHEHVQGDLPELVVPEGIELRPYRRGVDDRAVWVADNEAFRDHWGFHSEFPFEEFEYWVNQSTLRPELSTVAWAGDEVAGLLLNEVNEQENARTGRKEGIFETLAVRRPFRRRGLGTALLVRGLRLMQAAGMESVALGADSENLTGAVRIYERLGFQVRRRYVAYRLDISEA
jgi:mycothiol synthase